MISLETADAVLFVSLAVSLFAYFLVARREGSFLNILTPDYLIFIPALYFLPALYNHFYGAEASPYAFTYVYATVAVQNLVFALVYVRRSTKTLALPVSFSYRNFTPLAFLFLALSFLVYLPILLEFPEYLLDPRQIYIHTRSGYGGSFFLSTALAYLSIIFILFSRQSWRVKGLVIAGATAVLSLHGSKGAILAVLLFCGLYEVYVRHRRVRFLPALLIALATGIVVIGLFVATMGLTGSALEALETITQYSDYSRNGMLVIDGHFPLQYGRLTLESNVLAVIPRALMPNKPKNFGPLLLAEEFFPQQFDEDTGAPAFVVGVEYADFGVFAIVYLALFAAFRGWLARIFVNRLRQTKHPGDFVIMTFLAGVPLFSVGAGWLLPETVIAALFVRYLSSLGNGPTYRELRKPQDPPVVHRLAAPGTDPA
jgi:O-antigen polymerase